MVVLIGVLYLKLRDFRLGLIKQVLDHLHLLGKELHLYKLLRVFNLLLFVEELERLLPHPFSLYCSLIINHQAALILLLNVHALRDLLKQGVQAVPKLIVILKEILLGEEVTAVLWCRWAVI